MAESAPAAKKLKQNTLGGYFSLPQSQGTQSGESDTDDEQESESGTEKDDGVHSQPGKSN